MRKIENYSRVNFALILILFIFILENCKKEEAIEKSGNELNKTEAKQANQDYAIILNQNGIPFYQTALDLKSKFDSIPFGGRIILTNENINSDSQEAGNWFSAIYQGKKGFVFSDNAYSGKEWIQMSETKVNNEKTKQDEAAFSVVQSMNTVMYDLPSIESKKIGEIPQFSLISILSSGYYFDSFFIDNIDLEMGQERLWYEVSYNGKNGYILNSINYPVEKSVAEEQLRDKILSERGYFALTTKEPTLYNIDTKELFGKDFKVKLLKENIFFDTTESRLINGEQVYLIYFSDKMSLSPRKKPKNPAEDNTPYAAYISAKDGNYYSEEKFSEYTIENTKYKGDIA
ncbi:MAG TPA: hypothetical protein PKD50_14885, partial [Leptospiraceae bacterium]|nr:hypothetical protein [Leptospiraceae bacterium]